MNKSYCVIGSGGYVFTESIATTKMLCKRTFLLMSEGRYTDEEVESRWRREASTGLKIGAAPKLF